MSTRARVLQGVVVALAATVVVVGLRVSFSIGYRHGRRDALWPPRDVPARVPRDVPVCAFWVNSPTSLDWAVFDSAMRQFAALHAFQRCEITSWSVYSGPKTRLYIRGTSEPVGAGNGGLSGSFVSVVFSILTPFRAVPDLVRSAQSP